MSGGSRRGSNGGGGEGGSMAQLRAPVAWRTGLLAVCLWCSVCVAQVPTPQSVPYPAPKWTIDVGALLDIRDFILGNQPQLWSQPPITALDSWQENTDPCDPNNPWFGVTCGPPPSPRIVALNLQTSRFQGPIPSAIARLNFLSRLKLDLNKFNGSLPEELGGLSNLKELDLEFNQISGPFPEWISNFRQLRLLKAASNRLNGTIPSVLSSLSSLTYLDLSSNRFEGNIPDLSNLLHLEHLLLTANNLNGTLPDWLDRIPVLSEVSLRKNHLTGPIPNYSFALGLEHLYLGYNNLSGSLPSTIGSLTSLSTLFLPSNNIEGSIPASFSNMSSLSLLDLSSNPNLGGQVPEFLENLDGLALLQLTSCSFNGTIPTTLSTLTNLQEMYLDDNQLVGPIPPELGNLTALTQLYLSLNQLSGDVPEDLCQLTNIVTLNLANNQLNGTLPQCLVEIPTLRSLIVSDNLLHGELPIAPSEELNFQYNKNCFLDAPNQLPLCVSTWSSPYAPVTGTGLDPPPAPDSTPGAPAQQGGSPTPPAPVMVVYSPAPPSRGGGGFPLWASVMLVILAFFFLAFLAYTFSYSLTTMAASVVNRPDQLPVQEFSLSKIKKATKNFTTVYGRGSFGTVYLGEDFRKGYLDPRVIIKRAAEPQKLGEFLFKCKVEVLARARHRYLVNLLGYCTGKGERILVYEYLPNGTLFDRLHRPELEPLPWDVRVRIAVSVACALEHLHHELTPPLVHRAVTSSNILLAADMTAKLSDFGIARGSLGTAGTFDDTPRRRSKARGAAGGRGPGGVDSTTTTTQGILQLEKVDVYGFGVVLLELITGQKAMKEVHITSVAAPFLEDPQMMPLMVDPQLGGYFNQSELIELASIARDCVRDDPMARPSMRDVLQCMEDRLRLDTNLFENTGDDGNDMLTEGYATSSAAPTLANPPHVRQASGMSSSSNPVWQGLENLAMSVKSVLMSPGGRHQELASSQGSHEDFEMSSLLVMSGAGSAANDSSSSSSRLSR